MKFWNVSVIEAKRGGKVIFTKRCLTVQEANELKKAKMLEYPDRTKHMVEREQF